MFNSVRTKVIAAFACASVIILVAVALASYQLLYRSEHSTTDFLGYSAAQFCSASVAYLVYSEPEVDPDSEHYREVRESLRFICQDSGMSYMYAYYCDVEAGTVNYLICVAADDADDERMRRERGYGTVVNVDFSEQELQALRGDDVTEASVVDNQFGAMLAWYDPVDIESGLIAGAEYAIGEQRARVMRTSIAIICLVVLAMLALLFVQLRVLQANVFRPLRAIAKQMKGFSAERALDFEPLGIRTQDEMGEIADAFEGMASDINAYLGDIEHLTTERVQGEVELDVARRIQLGMVPERSALEGTGFETCAIARPARQVGGDFYDCLLLDDGQVAVVVGDVSGKGVAAALFMAMAKTMIREGLAVNPKPAEVLNQANKDLCQANPEGMFVTVFAAVLDPATGEVRFANAGHMPPLAIGGRIRKIDADPGTLLGLFDDAELQEETLDLREGESLLLFTDGVTEAVSVEGRFLGQEGLVDYLDERVPYANAEGVVKAVLDAADDFAAGREQFDDLTVVALRREKSFGVKLAVDIASFAVVRDEVFRTGIDEATARRVCLACEEAFANIVSYSGARDAWFSVTVGGGELSVTFADDGVPFDPTAASPVERAFEELDGGGMGISLIRQTTSGMVYRREQNRNVFELRFEFSQKP